MTKPHRVDKRSLWKICRETGLYRLDTVLKEGMLWEDIWAAMPEEMKFSVILSKSIHTSTLILRDINEKTGHGGRNHILSELRKKYWIRPTLPQGK